MAVKVKRDKPVPPKKLAIEDVQAENMELKMSLAELYEEKEREKVDHQLALAEMYDLLLG